MGTLSVYGVQVPFDGMKTYGLVMPGERGNGLDLVGINDINAMLHGIFSNPRGKAHEIIGAMLEDQQAALEFLPFQKLGPEYMSIHNMVGLLTSVKQACEPTGLE